MFNTEENLQDLLLAEQELRIITRQSGLRILRYDIAASKKLHDVHSQKPESDAKPGAPFPDGPIDLDDIFEDDVEGYKSFFEHIHQGVPTGTLEMRIKTMGEFRWFRASYSLVYAADGQPTHALITFYDSTEQRELRLVHDVWEAGLGGAFSEGLLYVEVNLSRNRVEVQKGLPAYCRSGRAASLFEAFVGHGLDTIVFSDDHNKYREFFNLKRMLGLFEAGVTEDWLTYRIVCGTNDIHWVRAHVRMMPSANKNEVRAIVAYEDTDQKQRELERLARKASHDSLTGILNREGLEKTIVRALEQEAAHGTLFMIDLDNFKQVNDTLGHSEGDAVLVQAASALRGVFGETGIVGRLGGDEFMAFVPKTFGHKKLEQLAMGVVQALQIQTGAMRQVGVSASVGIALRRRGDNFAKLYDHADIALYAAKKSGKCQYRLYSGQGESAEASQEKLQNQSMVPISLQKIMEHLGGGVCIAKLSGHGFEHIEVLYASPSFARNLDYDATVADVRKEQLLNYITKEDQPRILAAIRQTACTGVACALAYHMQMPDSGRLAWHHIHVTAMPGERDDYRLIIGLICDISDLMDDPNK